MKFSIECLKQPNSENRFLVKLVLKDSMESQTSNICSEIQHESSGIII